MRRRRTSLAVRYDCHELIEAGRAVIAPAGKVGMNQLAEILADKGGDVLRIDADSSVFAAVEQMVANNVGSLLVMEAGEVIGIVTERDYLRRVTLEGRTDRDTAVREIVSSPVVVASPETTVDECMALMTECRIRHLPVLEHGEVVGIVSIGDVVKFQSDQQRVEIKYLNDFITAR
jgi:CBS domain-containing protein